MTLRKIPAWKIVIITSFFWGASFIICIVYVKKAHEAKIQDMFHDFKAGEAEFELYVKYFSFHRLMLLNEYDLAISDLNSFLQNGKSESELVEQSMVAYWYALGSSRIINNIKILPQIEISEQHLIKGLHDAITIDHHQHKILKNETDLIKAVDLSFSNQRWKNAAYALVLFHGISRYGESTQKNKYSKLSNDVPFSTDELLPVIACQILYVTGHYQELIELRSSAIPTVSMDMTEGEQAVLVFEILSLHRLERRKEAEKLMNRYLEMGAIKDPKWESIISDRKWFMD